MKNGDRATVRMNYRDIPAIAGKTGTIQRVQQLICWIKIDGQLYAIHSSFLRVD